MGTVWRGIAVLSVVTGFTMLLVAVRAVRELPPFGGLALLFGVLLVFSLATAGSLRAARRSDTARSARKQPPGSGSHGRPGGMTS